MENDGNGMPPLHATELEAVHGPLEPTSDPQVAERVHQLYSFDIDHEMVGNTQQSRSSELTNLALHFLTSQSIHTPV
jgi:hypothetical protein